MLVKKFLPLKFLFGVGQIVLAGILIATAHVYSVIDSTYTQFIVGCSLIIIMTIIQIGFTFIGINIYNARINFESNLIAILLDMICNGFGFILLIWFALAEWQQKQIWYIWGFLCIYPFLNQLLGMISVLFHSKKIIFQKYRSQN